MFASVIIYGHVGPYESFSSGPYGLTFKFSETCGADVAVGIDMSNFNADKQSQATAFINQLVDQIDTELTFDPAMRNAARLAVFGFSSQSKDIRTPLDFGMLTDPEVGMYIIDCLDRGD